MKPSKETGILPDDMFPVKVFIRTSSKEPEIYAHPHWHDWMEILYFISGGARQQINDRIFNVSQGDLVIINRDDIHSTYADKECDNVIAVLQFDPEIIKPSYVNSPETGLLEYINRGMDYPNPLDSGAGAGKAILHALEGIMDEYAGRKPAFELMVKAGCCEIAGLLVRFYGDSVRKQPAGRVTERTRVVLKNTFDLIDSGYSGKLTLEKAARASNVSVPHFCRLFRNTTGMTFIGYLTLYRVDIAVPLLHSGHTVTDTAYMCGFNSVSSFTRAFRKYKQCSPSSFMDEHLEKS